MKIYIRQFRPSDAKALYEAVLESVEHVSAWLPWCSEAYSMEDAELWASSARETWNQGSDFRFVIEDQDTLELLGSVGISQVVTQHRVGNLGYWIRASALNKGVCTEAAKQALKVSFQSLNFQRIEVHVLTDNQASNAVALKIGGVFEGVQRNKLMFNGVSLPANCYSLIPADMGL